MLTTSVIGGGDVDISAGGDDRSLIDGAVLMSVPPGEGGGLDVSTVGVADSLGGLLPEPDGEVDVVSGAVEGVSGELDPVDSLEFVVVVVSPELAATAELRTSPVGARSSAIAAAATAERTATTDRRYAELWSPSDCHAECPLCLPILPCSPLQARPHWPSVEGSPVVTRCRPPSASSDQILYDRARR